MDWLGLALGVARRGPGSALDPELVRADIERLDDVEGQIEDPEGHLAVLDMALLHLTPRWQGLGFLYEDQRLTERGAWGLPEPFTGPGVTKLSRRVAEPLEQRLSVARSLRSGCATTRALALAADYDPWTPM